MQQKIIGYHQDELGDWVAELACHHGQHVRHKPPFVNRPWVMSATGRKKRLNRVLNCLRCDRGEPANEQIQEKYSKYSRTTE